MARLASLLQALRYERGEPLHMPMQAAAGTRGMQDVSTLAVAERNTESDHGGGAGAGVSSQVHSLEEVSTTRQQRAEPFGAPARLTASAAQGQARSMKGGEAADPSLGIESEALRMAMEVQLLQALLRDLSERTWQQRRYVRGRPAHATSFHAGLGFGLHAQHGGREPAPSPGVMEPSRSHAEGETETAEAAILWGDELHCTMDRTGTAPVDATSRTGPCPGSAHAQPTTSQSGNTAAFGPKVATAESEASPPPVPGGTPFKGPGRVSVWYAPRLSLIHI